MTVRPVLAALIFTSSVLVATAAVACDWKDASTSSNQGSAVASSAAQGDQQTPPAKTN